MKARFGSDRMLLLSALVSLLLAGLASSSSSPDLFDNQLGDIDYCKLHCQLVIKNKSPAKVSSRPDGVCNLHGAVCAITCTGEHPMDK